MLTPCPARSRAVLSQDGTGGCAEHAPHPPGARPRTPSRQQGPQRRPPAAPRAFNPPCSLPSLNRSCWRTRTLFSHFCAFVPFPLPGCYRRLRLGPTPAAKPPPQPRHKRPQQAPRQALSAAPASPPAPPPRGPVPGLRAGPALKRWASRQRSAILPRQWGAGGARTPAPLVPLGRDWEGLWPHCAECCLGFSHRGDAFWRLLAGRLWLARV